VAVSEATLPLPLLSGGILRDSTNETSKQQKTDTRSTALHVTGECRMDGCGRAPHLRACGAGDSLSLSLSLSLCVCVCVCVCLLEHTLTNT